MAKSDGGLESLAQLHGGKVAREKARSEGRERVRPRDVEAVTKPREVPVSLCTLATAAVAAWRASMAKGATVDALDDAMEALERHLGPLVRKAA